MIPDFYGAVKTLILTLILSWNSKMRVVGMFFENSDKRLFSYGFVRGDQNFISALQEESKAAGVNDTPYGMIFLGDEHHTIFLR
ncbi:MAG TPA: hypothetical protein ENN79_14820 [Desulfobacteraceae bacterium]|nr:hypothetical protein [Desulfobacteraceae bacterium]